MSALTEENVLNTYIQQLPVLHELFHEECMIAITDREKFLGYIPGKKIDVKAEIGAKVSEKSSSMLAIKDGKPASTIVPKEVYGIPVKATGVPIRDAEENIIGAVMIGKSISNEESLREISFELKNALTKMSENTSEISSGAVQLFDMVSTLVEKAQESIDQLEETAKILYSITEMSEKTNVLGINASIVAARAGTAGNGFKVVASEIRKMAEKNHVSIELAQKIIDKINKSVESITDVARNTSVISEQQTTATKQNTDEIQHIETLSDNILNIAQNL